MVHRSIWYTNEETKQYRKIDVTKNVYDRNYMVSESNCIRVTCTSCVCTTYICTYRVASFEMNVEKTTSTPAERVFIRWTSSGREISSLLRICFWVNREMVLMWKLWYHKMHYRQYIQVNETAHCRRHTFIVSNFKYVCDTRSVERRAP